MSVEFVQTNSTSFAMKVDQGGQASSGNMLGSLQQESATQKPCQETRLVVQEVITPDECCLLHPPGLLQILVGRLNTLCQHHHIHPTQISSNATQTEDVHLQMNQCFHPRKIYLKCIEFFDSLFLMTLNKLID